MMRKTGGKGPGDCQGKEECEQYCDDPANIEECINFAVEAGFMPLKEAEQARKMLEAGITGGPGGCTEMEACETYCNDLSHMEECMNFAVEAGFMSPEEAAQARKFTESGITTGPGGCQGEQECRAFCENPNNLEECLGFSEQIGHISPDEAQTMFQIQTVGGPGGCKGEEECIAYCNDPAHLEECINFSLKENLMSPEEAQKILEDLAPEETIPPHEEFPEKFEQFIPPEGIEQFIPPEGFIIPPEGFEQFIPPEEIISPPEEFVPPPEEAPQSLFYQLKSFLAGLISVIGF